MIYVMIQIFLASSKKKKPQAADSDCFSFLIFIYLFLIFTLSIYRVDWLPFSPSPGRLWIDPAGPSESSSSCAPLPLLSPQPLPFSVKHKGEESLTGVDRRQQTDTVKKKKDTLVG